jgi:hypothetical protein
LIGGSVTTGTETGTNVLLVGNSYTNNNKLWQMLQAMLQEWQEASHVLKYTVNSYSLTMHLEDALREGDQPSFLRQLLITDPVPLDWVVLQEASRIPGLHATPFAYVFQESLHAAMQLNHLIANHTGAGTMFFMTWGRRNGDSGFPDMYPDFLTMNHMIEEGYRRYVEGTSTASRLTKMAPVGLGFERIYQDLVDRGDDPLQASDFSLLYRGDGSHPTRRGSFFAACVIYATISGKDPRDLIYSPSDIGNVTAASLKEIAYWTVLAEQETQDDSESCPENSLTRVFNAECKDEDWRRRR